jgi:hypothetical protein
MASWTLTASFSCARRAGMQVWEGEQVLGDRALLNDQALLASTEAFSLDGFGFKGYSRKGFSRKSPKKYRNLETCSHKVGCLLLPFQGSCGFIKLDRTKIRTKH